MRQVILTALLLLWPWTIKADSVWVEMRPIPMPAYEQPNGYWRQVDKGKVVDTAVQWDSFPPAPKISMGSILVTMRDGTASWVSLDSLQAIYTDQVKRMIDSALAAQERWVLHLLDCQGMATTYPYPCSTWVWTRPGE